jgi:hypothetical protein
MKIKKSKYVIFISLVIACLVLVLNAQVITKQGVNYNVHSIRIPLYLKILDFFDRHYNYIEIVKRITNGTHQEEQRVIKIFEWVDSNIKRSPEGLPVVDDHPLNIIIRGYGERDQFEDIFTILCTYAGFESFYKIFFNSRGLRYHVSFIKIKDKWYPFSAYYKVYISDKGKLCSVNDILTKPSLLSTFSTHIPNFETSTFLQEIKNMQFKAKAGRVRGQSPLGRLVYCYDNIFNKR